MRALGIDYGARRIGLAVSDATGLLARPLQTLARPPGQGERAAVDGVLAVVAALDADGDRVATMVLGWPRRLDGSPNDQTPVVEAFARALEAGAGRPVVLQDERLTSHEADAQLRSRERDWRRRKAQLDAAAAAIILQDYLDSHRDVPHYDPDASDACAD
jgi:putative holliday junction resolvase